MDVFSLRAYQQQCRVQGPEKHYCPCGCGKQVIPGTSLIIEVIQHAGGRDSQPEDEEFHIHLNGDDGQECEDEDSTASIYRSLAYRDAGEGVSRSRTSSQDEHDLLKDSTPESGTPNFYFSHDEQFEGGVCAEKAKQQTQKPSQHDHDHGHLQSNMPNYEHESVAHVQNGAPLGPEDDMVPRARLTKTSTGEAEV